MRIGTSVVTDAGHLPGDARIPPATGNFEAIAGNFAGDVEARRRRADGGPPGPHGFPWTRSSPMKTT